MIKEDFPEKDWDIKCKDGAFFIDKKFFQFYDEALMNPFLFAIMEFAFTLMKQASRLFDDIK